MTEPRLSVVILTRNEAENIEACLASLAHQVVTAFEVIVVDAASTDGTVETVERAQRAFPVPLRLDASPRILPVGEARNRGVELARAPNVAFLSADTEADERWTLEALAGLESNDIIYGRQIHQPPERTLAAAVRGLRYHFPDTETATPARYASNANAAIRKEILHEHPFGTTPEASAVDDLLLTERAQAAGHRIGYNPNMIVAHLDVTGLSSELNKNLREAAGWGAHAHELGFHTPMLMWGALLAAAALSATLVPLPLAATLLAAALWAPALRRALRRRETMPAWDLARGTLASPAFDLAYLAQYTRSLLTARSPDPDQDPDQDPNP